jgi:predicted RNase H-like HicB family nuclease
MSMTNGFTAVVEWDDEWFIAHCAEIPGASGDNVTTRD